MNICSRKQRASIVHTQVSADAPCDHRLWDVGNDSCELLPASNQPLLSLSVKQAYTEQTLTMHVAHARATTDVRRLA